MKLTKRSLSTATALVLALTLLVGAWIVPLNAAAPAETFTDEKSRTSTELTLDNGTKTGVKWTTVKLDGDTYGSDRVVNMAEFSLANTHLSMEVLNAGTYMVSSKTLNKAAEDYTKAHKGQTVLAAINGDLWMTKVHSSDSVTTQTLKVTRGVLLIDGEIWASQQIDQENLGATNAEKGAPAGNKVAFGVTSKNQPLVGSPDVRVTMTVNGKTVAADGLNRLPATNSLIVYNHRVNSSNYALNDAYEVELEVADSAAFTAGGELTATVKKIYPAGSTTRPAIGEKSIILTARGNKINTLKNSFQVGDTVTFKTSLTDRMGRTELWQDVEDAIGGHMQPIIDGKIAVANGDTSNYPTALIGYKDDGTVAMVTVTSGKDKTYSGLNFNDGYKFCTEMGYNSVFYLDGGGSTTFVTLEKGTYTVRNKCSDGEPRYVINGIAVVWNDEKVCDKQGSLDYIKIPVDMSAITPTYMDGALLNDLITAPNGVTVGYDETEKAFRMTTAAATNDPYATLEFSTVKRVSADDYKYLVFKVKTNHKSTTNFVLYYAAGSDNGAAAGRTKSFSVKPGMDDWQYITVDMSKISNWKGNINNIRLDIFDSVNSPADTSMYIGAIVLCKTGDEAAKVKDGWAPEGSITDYLAYLESLKPVVTEPPTEAPTEPVTEPETTTPITEPETTATVEPEITTPAPTPVESTAPSPEMTTPADTEPADTGCASAVLSAGVLLALCAAAVTLAARRKH